MLHGADAGGFFGRARDLAQLDKLVADEGALVTIVGPPGVGKTRLALELVRASSARDHLVCELGEIRSSDAMLARLAELLHVGSERERLLVRVGDALAEREGMLLVFDNVEQLIDVATPALRALRQAAPRTRWLVTSRMALGMLGEWRHEITPLATDGGDSDAARMLADRVIRARGAEPPAAELEVLARIGVRLDGMPLALELAASRIAAIGAAAVEARLEQQLDLLTQGPRDLDQRQRTLRRAIAWSWDLLDAEERRALACLSVFRGGFDLSAAEAVVASPRALDLVQALRERSLLHTQIGDGGEMRFGLYLSIREFAAGELVAGELADAEVRHAQHYAQLLEGAPRPAALLADRDNIFAAIERCVQGATKESILVAARLLLGLAALIDRSPLEPYLERLEAFLASSESAEILAPDLRCEIQITAGRCMRRLGRLGDAKRMYADALTVARVVRATAHEARLHSELGMVAFFESRLDDALAQWRTSIAMARELHDDRRLALDQTRCGMVLRESNRLDEARTIFGEALVTHRRNADGDGIVITLSELAQIHIELGELEPGLALLEEAAQIPPAGRTLLSDVAVLARTAFAHWERGDYAQGEQLAQRSLVHLAHIGYRRVEAGLHIYLALARYLSGAARPVMELEWARGQLAGDTRAAHLIGAWLANLSIVEDRDVARARFEALPALPADDPFLVASAILRLPLELDGAEIAKRAQELAAPKRSLDIRFALRAVTGARTPAGEHSTTSLLEVRPDGDSFTFEGVPQSLTRYRTLRRLLLKLVDTRLASPELALPWDQLFAAGWPGERVQVESARNRVKVAVSTLRAMGLRDVILHDGHGYLIAPAIEVRVVRRD